MENILSISVIIAVIFFGGLISLGNERQRKAIDTLSAQLKFWAIQDLVIKRKKLAHEVRIENPITWLNKIVTRIAGCDWNLQVIEFLDQPQILVCKSGDGNAQVLITPLSPTEIKSMKAERRSQIGKYMDRNPLQFLRRGTKAHEISLLNAGAFFDLELPVAWKGLTGREAGQMERIWLYRVEW